MPNSLTPSPDARRKAREWLNKVLDPPFTALNEPRFLLRGDRKSLLLYELLAAYAAHRSAADRQALGCRACGSHVEIREGLVDGCVACLKSSRAELAADRQEIERLKRQPYMVCYTCGYEVSRETWDDISRFYKHPRCVGCRGEYGNWRLFEVIYLQKELTARGSETYEMREKLKSAESERDLFRRQLGDESDNAANKIEQLQSELERYRELLRKAEPYVAEGSVVVDQEKSECLAAKIRAALSSSEAQPEKSGEASEKNISG